MKYCKNCGAQLEDDANYCIKCGTKVEQAEEVINQEKQYIDIDCGGIGKIEVNQVKPKSKKSKRNGLQNAAIVFLVLDCILTFIIGLYYWWLLFRLLLIIPATIYYCYKTELDEKVSVGFKVFVILIFGWIPGILMLLDNCED